MISSKKQFILGFSIAAIFLSLTIKSWSWSWTDTQIWMNKKETVDFSWLKLIFYPITIGGLLFGLANCADALGLFEKKEEESLEENQIEDSPFDIITNMMEKMQPLDDIDNLIDHLIIAKWHLPNKQRVAYQCLELVLLKYNQKGYYPENLIQYLRAYIEKYDLEKFVDAYNNSDDKYDILKRIEVDTFIEFKQIIGDGQMTGEEKESEAVEQMKRDEKESEDVEQKKEITKGIKVTFPDGKVICHRRAIDTFIETIKVIGLERVPNVGIIHSGYNLVSKEKRPTKPGRLCQHECDGWYIYSNISNETKVEDLKRISDYFRLGLKIEDGK